MRYYREATNEYLGEDYTIDELNETENEQEIGAYGHYIVEKEEVTEEVVDEIFRDEDTGEIYGKTVHQEVVQEEEGLWECADEFGNELILEKIPDDFPHEQVYYEVLKVKFVHTLTSEEKEEIKEQRKETASSQSTATIMSMTRETVDQAICTLYEKIDGLEGEEFAFAYYRRIQRGDVTIDDVPSQLQEIVTNIGASGYMAYNCPPEIVNNATNDEYYLYDCHIPMVPGDLVICDFYLDGETTHFEETAYQVEYEGENYIVIHTPVDNVFIGNYVDAADEYKTILLNKSDSDVVSGTLTAYIKRY